MAPKPVTIVDESATKRNFSHYLAVFLWIGWMTFYVHFIFIIGPLLYRYYMPAFTAIIGLMVLSAVYPIGKSYQPAWGYALGRWIMSRCLEYFRMKVILEDKEALEKVCSLN